MPELPEVESVRLGLLKQVLHSKITSVEVPFPLITILPENRKNHLCFNFDEFTLGIEKSHIIKISRRAKQIIFHFDSGRKLIFHLKMTGQLLFNESLQKLPIDKHVHILFSLSNGFLIFRDIRKFGYCLKINNDYELKEHKVFQNLGLEPFSKKFSEEYFYNKLQQTSSQIKSVLLSQTIVVGCGNIYCDEVCFKAKIKPFRAANNLSLEETKRLFKAIKLILDSAIKLNGTSFSNYRNSDGSSGKFLQFLQVYGRSHLPCKFCKTILTKTTIQSRTTVFCNRCQK